MRASWPDRFAAAMQRAKEKVSDSSDDVALPDFETRGELYSLALEMCPSARQSELDELMRWGARPDSGIVVDIAAGSGFLTTVLAKSGRITVYALDPSAQQLARLKDDSSGRIIPVVGSPDSAATLSSVPRGQVAVVTSLGGLHHVADHEGCFQNVAGMLVSGGRFVAADVCDQTILQVYFDQVVAKKCLTGHLANWLNEQRVGALAKRVGLEVLRAEVVPLQWEFPSVATMALFFVGLHAYDAPLEEIIRDLDSVLGVQKKGGKYYLNWPLLFFELSKQ